MKIGIPKEIKSQEARVGITPSGAETLVSEGNKVFIEKSAGICLLYTSPSPRDKRQSRMPSSA